MSRFVASPSFDATTLEALYFLIPLKVKTLVRDWAFTCFLLERAIVSILRQTDSRFEIFVIGHARGTCRRRSRGA